MYRIGKRTKKRPAEVGYAPTINNAPGNTFRWMSNAYMLNNAKDNKNRVADETTCKLQDVWFRSEKYAVKDFAMDMYMSVLVFTCPSTVLPEKENSSCLRGATIPRTGQRDRLTTIHIPVFGQSA